MTKKLLFSLIPPAPAILALEFLIKVKRQFRPNTLEALKNNWAFSIQA
jgi:hypothetical protein